MKQVLVVTGASRGIGAATARLAASRGYAVCVNFRENEAAAWGLVTGIQERGGEALSVQADVASEADVVRLFATVDEKLGTVTGLVNNAGMLEKQAKVETMTAERIVRVLATNVVGSFLCAREAVRRMSLQRGGQGGVIVNVSSAAARLGGSGEYVDYAASKGAVDTLTVGLAREVAGEGIRVNAVRPGIIDTEIHASGGDPDRAERKGTKAPLGRAGHVDEVANAILWLLSSEASYVTGAILDVTGGR
jgi:NAD(P)-dependent dehydrogenase (short-subunit alcohol dehydrogenase family)